ncbi:hypothetical protein [Streptomyces malaysiensis]|uniref:Uncharacterized protein n=1 Tax=Streptomyces malaysiensis subsp. samsunensis TaxID=459658 RepID=A0A9X2LYI0_STRMQ|nr:hypothetical protein [Streptomyces samsunensis]MCQ8831833.1 hypothetical protein [Streptomyces samsunensis]
MTTDQAIRDAKARWQRRRRRLIGYGQWQPFTNAEPVRAHVRAIQAADMSVKNIAAATGVTVSTLDYLLYGDEEHTQPANIRTEAAQTLLAYWPTLDDYFDGAIINATGTNRRLRALAAIGWPARAIHQHIDFVTISTIERARFNPRVRARLARAVRDHYNHASVQKPEDHGISAWVASRTRNAAAQYGWEDPGAWDEDTIDDPQAQPDWTGHCGTDHGWWLHSLNHIPTCQRCETAHQEWLKALGPVSHSERFAALGKARAAASSRGADLADEARELLDLGYSHDAAAESLGITKDHLRQTLKRHPDGYQEAA